MLGLLGQGKGGAAAVEKGVGWVEAGEGIVVVGCWELSLVVGYDVVCDMGSADR